MLAVAVVALLLILGRSLAGVYSDYLWYDSLGAVALWRARLGAIAWLRVGSAAVASAFAFVNLYAVRQSVVSLVFPRRLANLEIGEEVPGRYLMGAAIGLSIVLGVLLAVPQSDWTTVVLAMSKGMFFVTDPYNGADLGFYVYWLPFESAMWMWAFFVVAVVSVAVILLYALTPSLKWQRGNLFASTYVRRHFTVLVGVLLLLLAWSFRLDMYSLLIDGSGPEGAFSWVDDRVGLLGDLVLSLATLGAALIVLWAGAVGQFRLAGISVLTVVVASLVVREVAPLIAQHMGTDAERVRNEHPYIATRAGYTRRAFAVDPIPRADSSMVYPSLAAALPWVPVWDPPALARSIDAGRATDNLSVRIGWRTSPVGLVADVVDPPPPGASARAPWTVARILAAAADERGAPSRAAGPGATATDDTPLEAPLVYPGASRFAIIPDSLTHTSGILLESFVARLANAWSLQNFQMLSGDLQQPHPTLISHRDVRERIERLTPFFAQGRRIEPLLVGDSLYWSVDLYSVSSFYPLSRHLMMAGEDRSYVRHAAVAIVQASTGDVSVVPDSALDPIATIWFRKLPTIFGTWSSLPVAIRNLLPPPIDGLYAQANAFGRYGDLTSSDPPRRVPTLDGADTTLTTDDLPIVLPGAQTTAIALPLVDETDRLRGLLIGTGGPTRHTAWYPLDSPGQRWSGVLDRLRSVDSTGGPARDGPLARGRVRAIPVRSGIAFVQPTYRWRPQSSPMLSRLALLVGDTTRSVTPSTGPPLGTRGVEAQPAPPDPKASAAALYAAMREALRRGDWVAFGRAFEALGRALEQRPGATAPPRKR
jgi:uncharacterized membrane protein (UPF0182 family)